MKTNLDFYFKTSSEKEKNGAKFEISPEFVDANGKVYPEIFMIIRRFSESNPRTKAAMAAYYKPYARQVEAGTLPPEKEKELQIKLFIDISLVSWQGISDENGNMIEFSKENAISLFKSLPDLFKSAWEFANSFESYKEVVGN